VKWGRELVLAGVVALAGLGLYLGVRHDVQQVQFQDEELFEGFDPARVRTIIAENIARDWRIRVERDERGGWRLVDPSAMPANASSVEHLLAVALAAHGRAVPESERDPRQLGLEPPRIVIEIEEQVDGKSHHERVEIGGLDADNKSVNVRVRGHLLRVRRDLDTAADRQLDDFKTDLALEFTPSDVLRVRRSGQLVREGAQQSADVALELSRGEEGWRSQAPGTEGLQLDPNLVATWLQGLSAVHHSGFVDELGGPIDTLGLEPPELRLELELRDGTKQALRLGRPGHVEGQVWYGLREGLGVAWALDTYRVYLIGFALEDMVDAHLLRARRQDVTTIRLQSAGGELFFSPLGKLWQVALRRPGEHALDKALQADPAKISDLLGELETVELTEFRIGQSVPESPDAPAVWVGVGGLTQGGWFGDAVKDKSGKDCRLFQRRGENACSLVPQALYESVVRPIDSFWSARLGNIPEYEQVALAIQGLGKDLRYQRSKSGLWSRGESAEEAKDLRAVLDSLCFLRATRALTPNIDPPWDDKVTVKFTNPAGKELVVEIGRARGAQAGEEVEVIFDGHRAVAQDQQLHERLLAILRAP
jgi:hypothetical protein